jgi:predicted nucleic acid-binding protein
LPLAATEVILVDTNVLAFLLLEGDRTATARKLYSHDSDWRSEAFALVELSNVLATYVRSKSLTVEQGRALLQTAETIVTDLTSVAHADALESAAQYGISAYDARFIALARQLGTRLVTEDRKLGLAVPTWTMTLEEALG